MPPARCAPTPPCAAISCAATGSTGATGGHAAARSGRAPVADGARVRRRGRPARGPPRAPSSASTPSRRWPRTCGALEAYWDDAGASCRRTRQTSSAAASAATATTTTTPGSVWRSCSSSGCGRAAATRSAAATLFRFAASGWDARPDAPSPGGVFWVEQGRGSGRRQPRPQHRLQRPQRPARTAPGRAGEPGGRRRAGGATRAPTTCTRGSTSPSTPAATDGAPGTGLFFDKLRGDGTLDETLWTYNQGSMIGANVLLARRAAADRGRERRRQRDLPRPRRGDRRQGAAPLRRRVRGAGRRPSTRSCSATCSSSTPPPRDAACASASATP